MIFCAMPRELKYLLHLLDGTSSNVIDDIDKLNKELELYKPSLAHKPQIVAINKIDLPEVQSCLLTMKDLLKVRGIKAHFISGATKQGIPELMAAVVDAMDTLNKDKKEELEAEPPKVFRPKPRARRW